MTRPPQLVVVGSGRSGTTVFLESVAATVPGVAAVPRLAGRVPALTAPASVLTRLGVGPSSWRRPSAESTALFTEAGLTQELQASLSGASVTPADVPSDRLRHLARRLETVRRLTGAATVAVKNTAACGRVPVLAELLPDAAFVHVVRSPSAVVESLLATEFWPGMVLWWDGRTTDRYAADEGLDQAHVAARHWSRQVSAVRTDLAVLPARRRVEVGYAAFTRDPGAELDRLTRVGLPAADRSRVAALAIRPVAAGRVVPPEIRAAVEDECRTVADDLGVDL